MTLRCLKQFIGDHLPAAERLEFAGRRIDFDAHVDVFRKAFLGGRRERQFQRTYDDVLVDVFLTRQGVDQQQ